VLLFIAHGRRELVHVHVTANPAAAWVWRELIEATPWGRQSTYLVRDGDHAHGADFRARAKRLGIGTLLTPIRAPRANAIAEGVVGTLHRECLDHLIVVHERHLRAALDAFIAYYNRDRRHRSLPTRRPGLWPARSGRDQSLAGCTTCTNALPDRSCCFAAGQVRTSTGR